MQAPASPQKKHMMKMKQRKNDTCVNYIHGRKPFITPIVKNR